MSTTTKPTTTIDRNSLYVLQNKRQNKIQSKTVTTINKQTNDNIIILKDLVMDYVLHRSLKKKQDQSTMKSIIKKDNPIIKKKINSQLSKGQKLNKTLVQINININTKSSSSQVQNKTIVKRIEYNSLKLVEKFLQLHDKYILMGNDNNNSTIQTLVDEIIQFVQGIKNPQENFIPNSFNEDDNDDKVIDHLLHQYFKEKQRLSRKKDLQILKAKSIKTYLNQLYNNNNNNKKQQSQSQQHNYLHEYLQQQQQQQQHQDPNQKLHRISRDNIDSLSSMQLLSINKSPLSNFKSKQSRQRQRYNKENNNQKTKSKLTDLINTCRVFKHPQRVQKLRMEILRQTYDGILIDSVTQQVKDDYNNNKSNTQLTSSGCCDNHHRTNDNNNNNNNVDNNKDDNTDNNNNQQQCSTNFINQWIKDITISEKLFTRKLQSKNRKQKQQHTQIIVKIGKIMEQQQQAYHHQQQQQGQLINSTKPISRAPSKQLQSTINIV